MRVLVTGASGFTGKQLIKKLASENFEIGVFSRECTNARFDDGVFVYPYINESSSIEASIESFRPDIFIHLASMVLISHSIEQISELIEANITIPTLILDALDKIGCKRVITAGTSWQNFTATDEYVPANLYAATKQAFGDICRYYTDAKGFNVSELRLMDIYGENDTRPKLLNLLKKNYYGEIDGLNMTAGEQEIDFVHVDDVVSSIIHIARNMFNEEKAGFSTYRIGSGEITNLVELVKMIDKVSSRKLNVTLGTRPYREREVMKAWRGGRTPHGWKAKISLQEGLSRIFGKD